MLKHQGEADVLEPMKIVLVQIRETVLTPNLQREEPR